MADGLASTSRRRLQSAVDDAGHGSLNNDITTWIPQRPQTQMSREDAECEQTMNSASRNDIHTSFFRQLPAGARLRLHAKRRKALAHLLSDWEGRDCLLQLAQSILLLAYTLAPQALLSSRSRKRLHIGSEEIANVRRFIIAGRWISEAWSSLADKDVDPAAQASQIERDKGGSQGQEGASPGPQRSSFPPSYSPSYRWRALLHRIDSSAGRVADVLDTAAEGCELTAFAAGSSIFWRVGGGKLAARQRRGLERIALALALVSILCSLRRLEQARQRILINLRAANARLLAMTDLVHADDDAQTLHQGHKLSAEEALFTQKYRAPDRYTADDHAPSNIDMELRQAETAVRTCRRRLLLLRLERAGLRAELPFLALELVLPRSDHTRAEAWSGLVASLCHISRHVRSHLWRVKHQ